MSTSEVPPAAVLLAPAKLTVSLRVTGVREDGYHLLDAEMVTVSLVDVVQLEPGTGLALVDEVPGGLGLRGIPPGESNLVERALTAVGKSAAARVVKRIPPGAGLGGGSADAAAVLRWAGAGDPRLAARIGADVPFCVTGGRARVSGIGEAVEPMAFEERSYVLLLLPFGMSTASVFAAWDRMHAASKHRAGGDTRSSDGPVNDGPVNDGPVNDGPVNDGPVNDGPVNDGPVNDLELAALRVEPRLARWRDCLGDATGMRPRLAGSGSTWFVEGEPEALGLAGRSSLVLHGVHAPLVAVHTLPVAR
ncbi:MAG: 4-(cytidine 5'-diphospho)-2-C-methyl-D-erythritol kinase [Actinomycetota bacterium]|jgi:4-diphosphocytidyl-2-C-methyl-D-erythritol kinase|nr:4-(cytidine 5'-diphospho)-2-C-methyl-D-erythritol kinase [Actinomycetota bacterium]